VSSTNVQIALPSGRDIEAVITGRRGAKRMTLRVDPIARRVIVNGPLRISKRDALSFVGANSDWIEARLKALPEASPFAEGATILFRGGLTLLKRRDGRGAPIFRDGLLPELEVASTPERFEAKIRLALKIYAQSDALAYCEPLAAQLGKSPNSIALRDTRSRWGSCTSNGDIMVSWRLIGAPPKVFEYVVAHELAHLIELNHSPRFWAQVGALMPDWRPARTWLKANGAMLHALGR
jgi:predicted metal-dependent hydrolase